MVNIGRIETKIITAAKTGFKIAGKKQIKNNQLFDLASKELIPGAKHHPLFTKTGELADKGVALVHMTDYFPTGRHILPRRAVGVGPRNSVHTTVNHAVEAVNKGSCTHASWLDKKFAIILPFNQTLLENPKGIFLGGTTADLFTRSSIKLPKGTVIVRQSPKIPKGKLRVINAEDIEKFKYLKGVKIFETSELPHSQVEPILKKLGYETIENVNSFYGGFGERQLSGIKKTLNSQSQFISEELAKEMRVWKKFADKHGIIPTLHSVTPNNYLERTIEVFLHYENLGGIPLESIVNGKLINIRETLLRNIQIIKEISKKTGLPISFNTNILEDIIKKSKNISDVRKGIISRLKIKPDTSFTNKTNMIPANEYLFFNTLINMGAYPNKIHSDAHTIINSVPKCIPKPKILSIQAQKLYEEILEEIGQICNGTNRSYAAKKNKPQVQKWLRKITKNGTISPEQQKSMLSGIIYS